MLSAASVRGKAGRLDHTYAYLCDTTAKGTTGHSIGTTSANSGLVVDNLYSAITATTLERPGQACDIGRGLWLALFPAFVRVHPGAIAANDESLLLAGRGSNSGTHVVLGYIVD